MADISVLNLNNTNYGIKDPIARTQIVNNHNVKIVAVSTSGWTQDTTSQSGTTLYVLAISLNNVYVDSPSIDISSSTGIGLPTKEQQTAYDLLKYATVDGTTLRLYATAVPSTAFCIKVEGVD